MDYLIWTLIVILFVYVFRKYKKLSSDFTKYGVPQCTEWPFLGALGSSLFKGEHVSVALNRIYNSNKEAKYVGCHRFTSKLIILRDPELIKTALIKNFDHFAIRASIFDSKNDPLFGNNLAFINGEKWQRVRHMMSPAFTSSKLRNMFVLMSECAENFSNQFMKLYSNEPEVDTKDAFSRYTSDTIATCAFGVQVDSLKNRENEFFVTGNRSSDFQKIPLWKLIFMNSLPSVSQKFGMKFISKEDTDYFINVIDETIRIRKETGEIRPDMLQLLMEAQATAGDIDLLELTANAFIFFLGGFESSASQMCLIANELAINQDIQRKLQTEIDAVMKKSNGKPTYEMINDMPYMNAVFSETMRMYPVPNLTRVCSKDFELPPALPGSKPYVVKNGDKVWIPNISIHYDPKFYEDPEKFNPDRFLDKKMTLTDVTFLGFGMGPRACIGNRFAILETKVLFLHLLSKCDLLLCEKSPYPFEHSKFSFVPTAKNGFYLKIQPRK